MLFRNNCVTRRWTNWCRHQNSILSDLCGLNGIHFVYNKQMHCIPKHVASLFPVSVLALPVYFASSFFYSKIKSCFNYLLCATILYRPAPYYFGSPLLLLFSPSCGCPYIKTCVDFRTTFTQLFTCKLWSFICAFRFSSHNWNTLFMGTSSVADVIAQKYNTSKSQVLDHVSAAQTIMNIMRCVLCIFSATCSSIFPCFCRREREA